MLAKKEIIKINQKRNFETLRETRVVFLSTALQPRGFTCSFARLHAAGGRGGSVGGPGLMRLAGRVGALPLDDAR